MRKIRPGVFETNSSMTHACVIMTEDQYYKWKGGKLYYCRHAPWCLRDKDIKPVEGNMYTKEEALSFIDPKDIDEYESAESCLFDNDFLSFNDFFETEYLEADTTDYTTPGGEKIVVCCRYGADY